MGLAEHIAYKIPKLQFITSCVEQCYQHLQHYASTLQGIQVKHYKICMWIKSAYPAVPGNGLGEGVVCFWFQIYPVGVSLHEVEVLVGGRGLLLLVLGRPPLVGWALQVVLLVHLGTGGEEVVHHHQTNVLAATLKHTCLLQLSRLDMYCLKQFTTTQTLLYHLRAKGGRFLFSEEFYNVTMLEIVYKKMIIVSTLYFTFICSTTTL